MKRQVCLIAAVVGALVALAPVFAAAQEVGRVTNLPIPRFVSLKADEVNVRVGPGADFPVSWTYVRFGLPVEIIEEFDNWRRVRDANGNEGWISSGLLSGDRWIIVLIANDGSNLTVFADPDATSNAVAYLEPGVLARVERCSDGWCRLTHDLFSGWARQSRLWGVYPSENFD